MISLCTEANREGIGMNQLVFLFRCCATFLGIWQRLFLVYYDTNAYQLTIISDLFNGIAARVFNSVSVTVLMLFAAAFSTSTS